MKTIAVILLLLAFPAQAEICSVLSPGTYPRVDIKLKDSYIRIMPHPSLGGNAIVVGWPTVTPGQICCMVSHFDPGTWNNILTAAQNPVAVPATEFAISLPALPWTSRAAGVPWVVQACQEMVTTMAAAGSVATLRVVRNAARTDGSRPMYMLNAAGTLVNLRVNGAQAYVEAGKVCEQTPPLVTQTPGRQEIWLYTTNAAGVRGIALCKFL